jgi:Na+-translocating ferredoxin:NAD+ oxidoreductase RNF subunit RnfB
MTSRIKVIAEQLCTGKEVVVNAGGVETVVLREVDDTYTTYIWDNNSVTVTERDATKDSDES